MPARCAPPPTPGRSSNGRSTTSRKRCSSPTSTSAEIAAWRKEKSLQDTALRRPDLLTGRQERPQGAAEVSAALIHYPVLNKEGKIVTSSITNLDLHDIARSAKTFGIGRFYVVHPTKAMRRWCDCAAYCLKNRPGLFFRELPRTDRDNPSCRRLL